jgi:3-methylcrotonyl-CoA carboxylase alpha subunit
MRQHRVRFAPRQKDLTGHASGGALRAPMPGRLSKIFVRESDGVALGDRLAIVEAMKMEHVLHAPAGGRVARILHSEGDQVDLGAVILELDTDGDHASD